MYKKIKIRRFTAMLIFTALVLSFTAQNEYGPGYKNTTSGTTPAATQAEPANPHGLVKWMSFKEAQELVKKQPKPLLIDVYTDWCGWCKHMDKTTYSNQGLAQYINNYFYPVKFDAETKDTIEYNGQVYKPTSKNPKTPHELAIKFLGNSLSYPSTIFVTNNFEFSMLSQGYLDDKKIQPLLVFMVENVWRTCVYEDFEKKFGNTFYDTNFVKRNIKTYTIQQALVLQKKKPKKLLVDIYANFCNSCSVQNFSTFTDTSIASYVDKNFYLVKFDAESADTILFNNEKFSKQVINGYPMNTFAAKITSGRLSLPSLAILDEKLETIDVLNMYQHPKNLKPILFFYGGNHYKTKKWPDFYADWTAKSSPAKK